MVEESYTHGHHETVLRSHRWRTAENSAGYLLPLLRPGLSLLDVGCGPGSLTLDLAERVAPGRVIGVDSSPDVIAQARALAVERGIHTVEFAVGDAYALDFPDESFDVVHVHQLLHHVARPVDVLRELLRLVASEGIVAVRETDYAAKTIYPESSGLTAWAELYQRVHRSHGGEPDAGRRVKAWTRAAGFSRIRAGGSSWYFSSDEERAFWGGMWADRALHSAFADDALALGATRDELQAISDAWQAWAADPDGWLMVPSAEILAQR